MKANHYYGLAAMIMIMIMKGRISNCKLHKDFSEGMKSRKFYHRTITIRQLDNWSAQAFSAVASGSHGDINISGSSS